MPRERLKPLRVLSLFALAACATTGGGASSDACRVPSDAKPYTISVSNRGGATATPEVRQAIANAFASAWGEDENEPPRTPRYVLVARELHAQVPRTPEYTFGEWRVRSGDSVVALLTYRRGSLPELDLPTKNIRREVRDHITRAVGLAVADAINGHAVTHGMPLELAGSEPDEVTLEVRFGWTPPADAAVASFARQERPPRHRGGIPPRYPDEYRLRNIEGSVMVGFIIEETGRVRPGSIRIVSSDGEPFTSSVRNALVSMRFVPQMINCELRPVVVFQPFNFSLVR